MLWWPLPGQSALAYNPDVRKIMRSRVMQIVVYMVACTGTSFLGSLPQSAVAQDSANLPYMNPQLPPEQRATDLVRRMTLAEKASQMQNNSAAVPRLKVPAYQWWSEALHGVINEGVTEYPEPIGLAATFDAPCLCGFNSRRRSLCSGVEP
jgi:beta-glucosidase